jgi:hemerythrin superfamily protein
MPSATQLITRDHKKVDNLFKKFSDTKTARAKERVCKQVIEELEIHAKLEEEIFYPAVRQQLGEEEMLDEARQEHEQAKAILRELDNLAAKDERLEEKFSELVECIQHHVEEEEGELLPKVEDSRMDLSDIGEQMVERREELMRQASKLERPRRRAKRKSKTGSRRRRSGRAA